jgi:hypothetical protein
MSLADARLDGVTSTSGHRQRGFLLSLLTLVTLAGAIGFGPAVDASASTHAAAETRVRAIGDPAAALVAADDRSSSIGVKVSGASSTTTHVGYGLRRKLRTRAEFSGWEMSGRAIGDGLMDQCSAAQRTSDWCFGSVPPVGRGMLCFRDQPPRTVHVFIGQPAPPEPLRKRDTRSTTLGRCQT